MRVLEEIAYRALPRVRPGCALSDWEWRVLVAAAEVIQQGSPVVIAPERVADNVETFLIEGSSRRAWRVRVLLALIETATLARTGRPFSRLSLERRSALVATRFERGSTLWWLCAKIRYLVLLGIYGDEAAVSATGYVPVRDRARFAPEQIVRPRPSRLATPVMESARAS